jgi:preprotein translocase subunit SecG
MGTLLTVLTIIVCVLLIAVVLIQNPKGGGLAIGGSGSQLMGVQKTTDFLEKTTWTLAILLIVLAMSAKMSSTPETSTGEESELKEKVENAPVAAPQAQPTAPAPAAQPAAPAPEKEK